ncbi:MAG: biotin synthase BioB [Gammaproteobacteria bacterium]|nr:biotin synthase BioB [Gammaproteobacteria bacterium]
MEGIPVSETADIRHDWTLDEVRELASLPFNDLLFQAQSVHRRHFDPHAVQMSTLVSVKTGGCPEDCAYCPQSVHHDTAVQAEHMMDEATVLERARAARDSGATRFCMGAALRSPKPRQVTQFAGLIREVSALGMETCATLGMLSETQARELKEAGLDYYNHNLDTSAAYYPQIIGTRSYQDRLDTLQNVRNAGLKVCCGGIIGLGEQPQDRLELLHTLATLPVHPESVPINQLVPVAGTPLQDAAPVDPLDFVRVIALARILMPASYVRLSAGRTAMSDEMQALCFLAGANSIFYGERLLTTPNPDADHDLQLLDRLGLRPAAPAAAAHQA